RQQILCGFCSAVFICSVLEFHKKILRLFLGLFLMECAACLKFLARVSESRGGFLVLGCFSQAFNFLWLFLLFAFGLRMLQLTSFSIGLLHFLFGARGKSIVSRNGFSWKSFNLALESGLVNRLEKVGLKSKVNDYSAMNEFDDSDDEMDVLALRRLVRIERERALAAELELEKERMAAASAADETMAMILRLQSEKSCLEIESNQYRRVAEQKHDYDQQVIQSIIMKHELERSLLEEKLRICRQKLQDYLKRHEMDELDLSLSSLDSCFEDCDLDDTGDGLMMMVGFESPAVQTKVF
ncbi:Myosin-binding protein 3, partial [Linum perenne]